ncbi:MAG: hypothetical protein ACE5H9_04350 [Anaerolineae bacterium]
MPACTRTVTRLTLIILLSSLSLGLALATLTAAPVQAGNAADEGHSPSPGLIATAAQTDTEPPAFPANPLLTPTLGITVPNPRPSFTWLAASDGATGTGVVSYTLRLTGATTFTGPQGPATTATVTATLAAYTSTFALPDGPYTWTVRAHDGAGNASSFIAPETFVVVKDVDPPAFPANPLITPTNGISTADARPTFDWLDATDAPTGTGVVSYTLLMTHTGVATGLLGQTAASSQTTTFTATTDASVYTPAQILPNGLYTWTVRAHDGAGNASGFVAPETFTLQAVWQLYLPTILKVQSITPSLCPTTSTAQFETIPFVGSATDRPDALHGDLNLSLRGYATATGQLGLVIYSGGSDANAPQLSGLFEPNRLPAFSTVYRANQWNFSPSSGQCEDNPDQGSRGPVINSEWQDNITMLGLAATPGEAVYIPERSPEIFGGGFKALVLYAEETRITLSYLREDTIANGYAVHLENVCVDPNLLALYRAQRDSIGCHVTGQLPALKNNQALGTALGDEIQVAIRDRGKFMDPRSKKDWWQDQ